MLIPLSGLPGTGKTTVASLAAGELSAVYLRIDSNRATDASSGSCGRRRWIRNRAAAAADNLALGRTVIADCVNPWPLTRDAWQQVGQHRHLRVTASAPNGNCRFS
jgi:predicted kinase